MRGSFKAKFIVITFLAVISCHDKEDPCNCPVNETCIHDTYTGIIDCYENGSFYHLGGHLIHARNLYVGIVHNNQCIDTLIFYDDTLRALDDQRFGLIANVYPSGIHDVMGGNPPYQVSENEFYSQTVDRLCGLKGEDWYANLHFKVYQDSVWMKLGFWTLNTPPGVLIDSCEVRFYKTK